MFDRHVWRLVLTAVHGVQILRVTCRLGILVKVSFDLTTFLQEFLVLHELSFELFFEFSVHLTAVLVARSAVPMRDCLVNSMVEIHPTSMRIRPLTFIPVQFPNVRHALAPQGFSIRPTTLILVYIKTFTVLSGPKYRVTGLVMKSVKEHNILARVGLFFSIHQPETSCLAVPRRGWAFCHRDQLQTKVSTVLGCQVALAGA